MSTDANLISLIQSSRKSSEDGSIVIYNLTNGLDFSNPKKIAETLAKVFFETDGIKWFEVEGDHIAFNPTFKVKILLAEEHSKLLSQTVNDFLKDLKSDEVNKEFAHQIHDISTNEEKQRTVMGFAAIGALLNKPFYLKDDKTEVEDQLFTQMLGYLEIRTPDDKDLIDWENLPI